MSRDVLTVGSTMRIPLLYRGEYSQWVERFMNYLEEQMDGENLMDINIDALYNILKHNQGDVNDTMESKKKTVVVTSDPLALIAEKTNVSKSKEKVVISSDSKGSDADDFNLDTFSSVRRPKNSGVIWKKKGSTSNVGLSAVSVSNLNKNVKRYSRKDLLACNNSHLGEASSAYMCNDAMNVSCDSRMCDLVDDNNFFIFDDESVKISPVSKMPFRKKPRDYMNVRSKSTMNKSLPRTVHKWLPKMQPLAKPIAKWSPRVKHCLNLSLDHRFEMFKAYDG
nr:hypothetical protein [Tanacetum cinerariifolium]